MKIAAASDSALWSRGWLSAPHLTVGGARQLEFKLMSPFLCAMRRLMILALVALPFVSSAHAQTLDLSLNVFFNVPFDETSGGTWQVAAKTSSSAGISGLDLQLAGITGVASPAAVGPRGLVNGSDPAGFSQYEQVVFPSYINVILGQRPAPLPFVMGEEQTFFYGVGNLANGQPGDVGPVFISLTDTEAVPWATGDPFGDADWDTAAILAEGVFSPGQSPGFSLSAPNPTSGLVFTALGSSIMGGPSTLIEATSTIVRNNRRGSPDYNGNGVVDAADYTVWRDMLGQSGPGLAADGTLDDVINDADYDYWKANFGLVIPGSGGGGLASQAVPEPASGALLIGALGILFLRRQIPLFRSRTGL